ncbi:tripartite tricarboxylate transporter substrate binding protein [Muricoccus vinaceus]|uniref:Tripartite tricarboxylate transporter substrate binding protein n=1 Tax=Muricoccus vinaceus TaxID=424704 RepID=A0ABV6IRC2_9PROT
MTPNEMAGIQPVRERQPVAVTRRNLSGLLASLAAAPAAAQQPSGRPQRIVVPYGAGGITDSIGRIVADSLRDQTGQVFIVENRAGAGGALGAELAARAAPDGQLLLVTELSALSVTPSLAHVSYDPEKDFAPIAMIAFGPLLLAMHPAVSITGLPDLVAQAGRLNLASAGNGSMGHLAAEELQRRLGTTWQHVPFRSGSEAINAVIGRHVDGFLLAAFAAVPYVADGRLRPIAVAAERRLASMPNVPTFAELGTPDFVRGSWQAVFAPAGTSAEVTRGLAERLRTILGRDEVRRRLAASGAEVAFMDPEALGRFLREDRARWQALIRAANIQVN